MGKLVAAFIALVFVTPASAHPTQSTTATEPVPAASVLQLHLWPTLGVPTALVIEEDAEQITLFAKRDHYLSLTGGEETDRATQTETGVPVLVDPALDLVAGTRHGAWSFDVSVSVLDAREALAGTFSASLSY